MKKKQLANNDQPAYLQLHNKNELTQSETQTTTPLIQLIKKYNSIIFSIEQLKKKSVELNKFLAKNTNYSKNLNENHQVIEEKEYQKLLQLVPKLAETIEEGNCKRKEKLENIEDLLKKGENPNIPEQVFQFTLDNSIGAGVLVSCDNGNIAFDTYSSAHGKNYKPYKVPVKIYPLEIAKDKDLIHLLLDYGATQNNLGYIVADSSDHHDEGYRQDWDNVTALEAACLRHRHEKIEILLGYSPCNIDVNAIDKSLLTIISNIDRPYENYYYPYGFHTLEIILLPASLKKKYLELIEKLSEKASDKLLLELLDSERQHEKVAMDKIQAAPDPYRYNSPVFNWFKLIRAKIDIYSACLSKRMLLSNTMSNNPLSDILINTYKQDIEKKIELFKIIYPILIENYKNPNDYTPIPLSQNQSPEEIDLLINDRLQRFDSFDDRLFRDDNIIGDGIIYKAVQLINDHYLDFDKNAPNEKLVNSLLEFAIKMKEVNTNQSTQSTNPFALFQPDPMLNPINHGEIRAKIVESLNQFRTPKNLSFN